VRYRFSWKLIAVALLALVCAVSSLDLQAAGKPLTKDDVTLLLLGGSSSTKMVELIKERGISFSMTAELAGEFRRDGADDAVIQALEAGPSPASPQTANSNASAVKPPSPASPPSSAGSSPASVSPSPASSGTGSAAAAPPNIRKPAPGSASDAGPSITRAAEPRGSATSSGASPAPAPVMSTPATPAASTSAGSGLADPSSERVQEIVQAFAAKETLFKQARDNYTYHQINKVEELGPDNQVQGAYQQDWDILYDDNGSRIERVTYAPLDTLKGLQITEQDLDAFRNIQPFVLTSAELPEYDIQYRGHVKVDELTAYVFSIRPKAIQKGRQYFQGMVWVDDRDLQIVKSEGKNVPEIRKKGGEENLFPRFTTWREQIDGKFWFPTFTLADDTLYFTSAPVHIREIVKYTDYKQFRATVRIKNVAVAPNDSNSQPAQTSPAQKSPPKK
jgi:hypothetical protein